GAVPNAIVEVCSKKTWRANLNEKRVLFASLGVKEYFLFDPEGRFIRPRLQGYRRNGEVYAPLTYDDDNRLHSAELGLYLKADGSLLRLIDARTGEPILTRKEAEIKAQKHAEELQQQSEQVRQRAAAL